MKEEIYDGLFEEKEEKTNWQAMLFKYIIRWPWFIASVIFCLVCAWLYLKTITPVYNISASMIIKDNKKGGNTGNDLSAFEDLGIISSSQNIDNEIEILRSKSLIKDVVSELELYISLFRRRQIPEARFVRFFSGTRTFSARRCRTALRPHLADRQLSVRQPDRCKRQPSMEIPSTSISRNCPPFYPERQVHSRLPPIPPPPLPVAAV